MLSAWLSGRPRLSVARGPRAGGGPAPSPHRDLDHVRFHWEPSRKLQLRLALLVRHSRPFSRLPPAACCPLSSCRAWIAGSAPPAPRGPRCLPPGPAAALLEQRCSRTGVQHALASPSQVPPSRLQAVWCDGQAWALPERLRDLGQRLPLCAADGPERGCTCCSLMTTRSSLPPSLFLGLHIAWHLPPGGRRPAGPT